MQAKICPCCGNAIAPNADLRIDTEAGIVISRGQFVALTRNEAQILELLQQGKGRTVSRESLLENLYLTSADEPDIKIIDVFVCKLRKKLKGMGVAVQTDWGRGYRLSVAINGDAA